MTRATSTRTVLIIVFLSVALIGTAAYAEKNGTPCKIAGAIEVTEGVTYTCKKSNGKLKWTWTKTTARVVSDQYDAEVGFQVKAIYVVPADGMDHSYDTNGYISGILDEGSKFLQGQLGLRIPIDSNAFGYDIQYLKSAYTTADFESSDGIAEGLLAESMALENPGSNRKNYIFFVDAKIFRRGTACGLADSPGISAVVAIWKRPGAIAGRCVGQFRQFGNSASSTWVHELFHNFGVGHTTDSSCDLMAGVDTPEICPMNAKLTIDKERARYVGSSLQGQDILQLRVWEGLTNKLDLKADCSLNPVPRVDGFNYAYCPTGTQTVGRFKYCGYMTDAVTLEGLIEGQWKSLGSWGPQMYSYGTTFDWKCHVGYSGSSMELTVATPGTSLYRWMVNGKESEQFKVIWVR